MKERFISAFIAVFVLCTLVKPVSASEAGQQPENQETDGTSILQSLPTPDLEALNITAEENEKYKYTVDASDEKVYVTSGNLKVTVDGKEYPAILVYDEKEETWNSIWATFMTFGGEIQLVVGDGKLYLFENQFDRMNVYLYDLETKEVKALASSIENTRREYQNCLVYDGTYIWMIGGFYQEVDSKEWKAHGDVRRFNLKTEKLENTDIKLAYPCGGAQAEFIDGKIIVTGGENDEGVWESNTEVIDCTTGELSEAAAYPEVVKEQKSSAASGSYDGKMIVTGMISNEDQDTYIYDMEADTWTSAGVRMSEVKLEDADGGISGKYFYVYGNIEGEDGKESRFLRLKVRDKVTEEKETAKKNTKKEIKKETKDSAPAKKENQETEIENVITIVIIGIVGLVLILTGVQFYKKNIKKK